MRGVAVPDVAAALGYEVKRRGAALAFGPCPACNAERRHTKSGDRRGAIGIRTDGRGWRCFQCDTSGDALDLVALTRGGARLGDLSDVNKADVREWCSRLLGLDTSTPASSRPSPSPKPKRLEQRPEDDAPGYPPEHEIAALWVAALPVVDVPEALAWLLDRFTPRAARPTRRPNAEAAAAFVADADLARALPEGAVLPSWARYQGRSWSDVGHRLIVPLYDAAGRMRSLIARRVVDGETPKSLPPAGHKRAGLVMADGLGRQLLETGRAPEWWSAAPGPFRIVVAEGEPSFLTWATEWSDAAEFPPATIGMVSGGWSDAIAARVPHGSIVVAATDDDEQGDAYAERVRASVAERATVERWRPKA